MPERFCILVSPTCDLSSKFISEHGVRVMPVHIRIGEHLIEDNRNPRHTLSFYHNQLARRGLVAESASLSAQEIAAFLEHGPVLGCENLLFIAINAQRSRIYRNTVAAVQANLERFKAIRRDKGVFDRFQVYPLDSESMFAGEALLAWEAVRLADRGDYSLGDVGARLTDLRKHIHAYVVPRDLYFLHARGGAKGDRSVGWFSYKLGSLFDVKPIIRCYQGETGPVDKVTGFDKAVQALLERARQAIDRGLRLPFIAASYAGDLDEIGETGAYREFVLYAKHKNVKTMLSLMSATAAVNVGPGAFALAYAE